MLRRRVALLVQAVEAVRRTPCLLPVVPAVARVLVRLLR
jgi:hypothetical protein